MKLLKLLFIPVLAVLFVACQDEGGVRPSSNKANTDVLGLVVPHSNDQGEVEKVLFLKDGRRVNPVSGIPNFDDTELGAKLLISFEPKKTSNGILDVSVTSFVEAQDSVFIPSDTVFVPGDSIFTPVDSVFVPPTDTTTGPVDPTDSVQNPVDTMATVFKGTFVMFNTDSTTGSEYVISDTLTLTFNERNFVCITANNFPLGGSGKFVLTPDKIKFKDKSAWPAGTDKNLVLDGWFNYYLDERNLTLYTFRDGIYISYYLHR